MDSIKVGPEYLKDKVDAFTRLFDCEPQIVAYGPFMCTDGNTCWGSVKVTKLGRSLFHFCADGEACEANIMNEDPVYFVLS